MAKLFNLARMTTATTGTGTITLGSAVSGFLSFAGAGVANGDVVSYGIEDGANREVGTGTYTSSGTTLSRTVISSTNSNSAISLSGSAQVFITPVVTDIETSYATTLPASPVNGQQAILVDSTTNPSYQWQFRYNANSTSSYKWEFVGGAPCQVENNTSQSVTTTSGSYTAFSTAGPSIALPRAGDYIVEVGGFAYNSVSSTPTLRIGYDIGATGADDADSAVAQPTAINQGQFLSKPRLKTSLSAVTLTMKYKVNNSMSIDYRYLRVTPVRVS